MPRNVLVTGANRGIGLELARQLLARGDHVVAACRQPGKATALNALAAEHPGRLHVLPLDVASARSRAELVRELPLVLGEDGRLDLTLNGPAAARAEAVVGLLTARGLLADLRRDGASTHLLLRRETLQ